MKQTITLTILLVGIFFSAAGQNFKQQFEALVSKNDTIGQLELLKKWEVADINDAEMYVAYFNFYVNKSRKHNIEISTNPKGKDVLQIMETDTA
jgi:hypothetical protein